MKRAVILTALPVEYDAVKAHLTDLREDVHEKGTVYEIGSFDDWEILIGETGPGNPSAAFETERAIQYFSPLVLVFVGVAGGIKDTTLGDVVAATKVYGYESGKAEGEKFLTRPDVAQTTYALEQRAKAESKKDDWINRIIGTTQDDKPNAIVKPIAAGEKVVASIRSDVFKFIREKYGDAVAVEMEGRGCLAAARANADVSVMIVRGISDLVKNKTVSDEAGWQETASRNASAFAFEMISKIEKDGTKLPVNP